MLYFMCYCWENISVTKWWKFNVILFHYFQIMLLIRGTCRNFYKCIYKWYNLLLQHCSESSHAPSNFFFKKSISSCASQPSILDDGDLTIMANSFKTVFGWCIIPLHPFKEGNIIYILNTIHVHSSKARVSAIPTL